MMKTVISNQLKMAAGAARRMGSITDEVGASVLCAIAGLLESRKEEILEANSLDLARMDRDDPKFDRLMLTSERIDAIAADVRKVASLPMPAGITLEERVLENGLNIRKVSVPLGVVGVIYEARPNVTVDVTALAIRSSNVVVLKGGSDAWNSNRVLVAIIHQAIAANGLNTDMVQLLPPDREAAEMLMNAVGYVDVLIPRGSQKLINSVRMNSKVPVIETGAGVVHTYFDESGDVEMGKRIIDNAKTRRPSVCNALECLIINRKRLTDLPVLVEPLRQKGVELFADSDAFNALKDFYPADKLNIASEADFHREFLSLRMSVKTVSTIDEALEHIYLHSTKHSDALISNNSENISRFQNEVDAAAVYINASTAFTDGAQFGLGAEIGISTQKLHARGPMALRELCSYKWLITGNGQTRK
jgi:glutamate-5-semialdehyde dehydrogenase